MLLSFLLIFIAILIFLLITIRWKRQKNMKFYREFRCNLPEFPILGHGLLFIGNSEDRMEQLKRVGKESYGKGGLTVCWVLHRSFVCVADPEVADIIMKNCLEKGFFMQLMQSLFGNGSFVAPVPIWKPRRKANLPSFSMRRLNRFVETFSKQSSVMVEQLRLAVAAGPVSVFTYFNTYNFDTVCETTFGVHIDSQHDTHHPFLKSLKEAFKLMAERMSRPWLSFDYIYAMLPHCKRLQKAKAFMCNFLQHVINSKRKVLEEKRKENSGHKINFHEFGPENTSSFLDQILESGQLSDAELLEECLIMVAAATDTSAIAMSFTALMLSRHPEVQERVYQELKEVFDGSLRPPLADDLVRLKYLEAVIKETLRLYPSGPLLSRKIYKDLTLPSGLTIPAGEYVIHVMAINRNPKYWGPDADEFKPERFLDPVFKHPAQFMAFSCGPRNCIGYRYAMMSMKVALSTLLRRYRLLPATLPGTTADGAALKYPPIRLQFDVTMKDVHNFLVELEPRIQN